MTEQIKEALNALIEEEDTELFENLIREQDINEPAFAKAALEQGLFHPAALYKDAGTQIRDQLIAMLEKEEDDTLNSNGILLALAAIGDETVKNTFQKWEQNPPSWRKNLYVGPAHYAMEGGWCIEDGRKKKLIYDSCYAIQKQENCKQEENMYGGPGADRCPHCGSRYVDILVVDGKNPKLAFLGIEGKIKIKTCESCIPWGGFIFCKYEEDGESKVICQDTGDGDLIEDEDWDNESCFVLSKEPVAQHYCSEWEGSAVGGVPKYVDDADYAVCPECGKRMKHLAQLGGEYTGYGNIYVQICTECKIAATLYQQS